MKKHLYYIQYVPSANYQIVFSNVLKYRATKNRNRNAWRVFYENCDGNTFENTLKAEWYSLINDIYSDFFWVI